MFLFKKLVISTVMDEWKAATRLEKLLHPLGKLFFLPKSRKLTHKSALSRLKHR